MMADTQKQLAVGDALPVIRHTVTQAMIDLYAEVSGDRNPLHIDVEFGRNSPFGSTIAHGLMTMAFATQAMTAWGPACELDVAFIGPVRPGEAVTVTGAVRSIEERDGAWVAICDIACTVGERTVMAGTALRQVADRQEASS